MTKGREFMLMDLGFADAYPKLRLQKIDVEHYK